MSSENTLYLDTFKTAREYIKYRFKCAKKRNPSFSLRAFSAKLGIPVSSISPYLNGRTGLSIDHAIRFINYFKFSESEVEIFMKLVVLERAKNSSQAKLGPHFTVTNLPDQEVYHYLKNLELDREIRYGIDNMMTFRVLCFYRDKDSKRPVPHFLDKYFSSEYQIASIGHFYRQEDGSYTSYLERGFQKESRLECIQTPNQKLKVSFDIHGFPSIESLTISILHSHELVTGKLIFSERSAIIQGVKFDPSDPQSSKQEYYLEFKRL